MLLKKNMAKSIWLLLVILFVTASAQSLSPVLLFLLALLLIALPFWYGLRRNNFLDEREEQISHLSSHFSFYLTVILLLGVMLKEFIAAGKTVPNYFFMILLVPLMVKFIVNFVLSYGYKRSSRITGYLIGGGWILFCLLSEGFSVTGLIQIVPGILLITAVFLMSAIPLISGTFLIVFSLGALYLFITRFDLYIAVLMSTLLSLPLAVSGLLAILSVRKNEEE